MSETTKIINQYFRTAVKDDVDKVFDKILLTERQHRIFELFYIRKMSIVAIADKIHASTDVVNKDLALIRAKIIKILTEN